MRSVHKKKVILMLPIHEADISCHCIINEIWYDTCAVIYIIPKVWLCWILIHVHHKTTRGNAKHSTCRNQESRYTLFAILHSSLIRIYTICHSQQSDQGQGLHCHSQEQSDQGLHYSPFSAVWSGSTLLAILSSLIKVNTICHSQQSYQGLHYWALLAV